MSELKALKDELNMAKKEIDRLRHELIGRSEQPISPLTEEDDENLPNEEKKLDEEDSDDIRKSAEKLLQWARYRDYSNRSKNEESCDTKERRASDVQSTLSDQNRGDEKGPVIAGPVSTSVAAIEGDDARSYCSECDSKGTDSDDDSECAPRNTARMLLRRFEDVVTSL